MENSIVFLSTSWRNLNSLKLSFYCLWYLIFFFLNYDLLTWLQNSLQALKPCVLRIPAYCYISDEVLNSDFRQSNLSHHCSRLLPFSSAYWLRDLHNDLHKSSCAFYCGVNPHRQVEPVLFGIQPFRWILCGDLLWKGNEGALLHNIHPSHTAKFHLLQLLKTFK